MKNSKMKTYKVIVPLYQEYIVKASCEQGACDKVLQGNCKPKTEPQFCDDIETRAYEVKK